MNQIERISAAISVLLADDHPGMRTGIRAILEGAPDIRVVGEAGDDAEVKQLAVELQPQVLLLDLRMPGSRPAEMVVWVRMHCRETAVLILTAHNLDVYLSAVVTAGAAGFVIKEEAPETIMEAVRRTARGEIFFSQEQLIRARRWRQEVGELWESLTEREREILLLVVQFRTNVEIAEELYISERTVAHHISHILNKLNMSTRREAGRWVVEHKLMEL